MELWQRFTSRARRAVLLAHGEASRTRAQLISTEHLLLGLLRTGEGTAYETLDRLGVDIDRLRADLERQMEIGAAEEASSEISFNPDAQHALQLAYAETRQMNDQHFGTEHILLGLLRLGKGPAYRLLRHHGVELTAIRARVADLASPPVFPPTVASASDGLGGPSSDGVSQGTAPPRKNGLDEIGAREMLAHLEVAIHDHSPAVRCQAIRALGEVGSPEQLQSLIPFLQVEDQAVRLAVVRALGSIGGDDAVGALVKLGSDNDLVVRWEAQAAVNRLLSGDKTSPSRPRLVPEQSPPVTFLD